MPASTLTWLLDKNVARRAIEGISAALTARALTYEQSEAVRLITLSRRAGIILAITPEAANILEQRPGTAIRLFLREVASWRRGRYWTRWARRLREHGFSPEDAAVLSYGTFGLDESGQTIGVTHVITFDRPLLERVHDHHLALERRLKAMTSHLSEPYRLVVLPEIIYPNQGLELLYSIPISDL
jgi:hypothetical protein